jgi:hypothetical protein
MMAIWRILMKKKLLIPILILVLLVTIYNVKEKQEKRTQIENIDNQIQALFTPTIKNTTFIIGDDKYILVMDNGKFHSSIVNGEEVDYFKALEGDTFIEFSVYKNEVKEENLIGSSWYGPRVRRDSLESDFYIDNSEEKNILLLLSRFNDVYYDYIYSLNEKEESDEKSGYANYDDGDIEYDKYGKPIKVGYIEYYNEISSKGLDLVFDTVFKMDPDGEKLDINISVINLQEEIKKPYMTKEKLKSEGKETTLYYHKEENHNMMEHNFGPMIIEYDGKLKPICLSCTSVPSISPDNKSIAYITPFEWEAIGELYIYDIKDEWNREVIKAEDIDDQDTVKVAKWLDDRYILTIIGLGYGTVSVGGDLYLYDTENRELKMIIDADSLDKALPEDRMEIMDFDILEDNITMKIVKHNKEFMEYTVEEKVLGKDEIKID